VFLAFRSSAVGEAALAQKGAVILLAAFEEHSGIFCPWTVSEMPVEGWMGEPLVCARRAIAVLSRFVSGAVLLSF